MPKKSDQAQCIGFFLSLSNLGLKVYGGYIAATAKIGVPAKMLGHAGTPSKPPAAAWFEAAGVLAAQRSCAKYSTAGWSIVWYSME